MLALLALITLLSMVLTAGLLAACVVYRRQVLKLRIRLRTAKTRLTALRAELGSATETVEQIVHNDPLERMWRTPAVTPAHERRPNR